MRVWKCDNKLYKISPWKLKDLSYFHYADYGWICNKQISNEMCARNHIHIINGTYERNSLVEFDQALILFLVSKWWQFLAPNLHPKWFDQLFLVPVQGNYKIIHLKMLLYCVVYTLRNFLIYERRNSLHCCNALRKISSKQSCLTITLWKLRKFTLTRLFYGKNFVKITFLLNNWFDEKKSEMTIFLYSNMMKPIS